jgi:hypothetical protein
MKHLCNLAKIFFVFVIPFWVTSCKTATDSLDPGVSEVRVMHPRVYWTENPQQEAIISWTATGTAPSSPHVVWMSTNPTAQLGADTSWEWAIKEVLSGPISLELEDKLTGVQSATYQHASVSGLQAHTTYFFKFCTGSTCSPVYHFRTAPADGSDVKVLFGGDSRTGSPSTNTDTHPASHTARREMNAFIASLFEKDTAICALIHGADYGMTASWWHLWHWFSDHELTITKDRRILPLIISQGNHDHAQGFYENFMLPNLKKTPVDGYYYSTLFSNQLALITLNTEKSMAGDQLDWFEKEIEGRRKTHPWLLVQYHRPAYPAVKNFDREDFAKVRKYWVPLLENYQVDLVLESDGHALKKTAPIYQGKIDKDKGIVYIGEGGMGVPQRKADAERWYFKEDGFAGSFHHVWLIHAKANELEVQALGMKGETYLQFSRKKKH